MICDCRTFIERLIDNGTLSESNELEMELYARKGCPIYKKFIDTLNLYQINKGRKFKEENNPTTQEQDHRSWWSKVRKHGKRDNC